MNHCSEKIYLLFLRHAKVYIGKLIKERCGEFDFPGEPSSMGVLKTRSKSRIWPLYCPLFFSYN